MDDLSRIARSYLFACYLLGAALGAWLIHLEPGIGTSDEWLLVGLLAICGGVAQLFVVPRAKMPYSDHLTPAILFAGFLLLPSALLMALVALTFGPEWLVYRRRWYIQVFNIVSWWVAFALGREFLIVSSGQAHLDPGRVIPGLGVLGSVVVVLGVQTLLIAGALRLARGQSLAETQLFAPEKLFVEVSLLCTGSVLALTWMIDPLYSIIALLPLGVIFQALHVPNLRSEATTDDKTGLANMRHFTVLAERELERSRSNGQTVSLLMCDLDYLRNVNNTYGHQAGDLVLQHVASVIRQSIRGCDVAARFGGEEFCILLPDTDCAGGQAVAERLRQTVAQSPVHLIDADRAIPVTLSIGLATSPTDGRTFDVLLHEADLAVYQAKRNGRNRVVAAGRESRELAAEWARENLIVTHAWPAAKASNPLLKIVHRATRQSYSDQNATAATAPVAPSSSGSTNANRSPLPRSVALLISVVCLSAVLGLVPAFGVPPIAGAIPWLGLAFFAGLTIVAEHLAVEVDRRRKTSVAVVMLLAATFLFGAWGALTTSTAFALWAKIKSKSPIHRMLFNFGMILLSIEGGVLVFRLLAGGLTSGRSVEWLLLSAIGASIVYFSINHLLLSVVRGLSERRSPTRIWRTNYQWLFPHYAVFGALAIIVALGFNAFGPVGVLALMAPVAGMQLAIKQYTDHTAGYVAELEGMNQRLGDSYEATLSALSRALDTRDEETEEHSRRVRRYSEMIAGRLGLSPEDIADIARGAMLHDVGKIGVPDAILLKPAKLTADEQAIMRRHPQIGYNMIAHIPFLSRAAEVVLHHHEAYDGSGYPSGLTGDRIPLGARIFAVADTLDAMTSDRPYRRALPLSAALAEIERCRGTQFDPRIVDTLLRIPVSQLIASADDLASAAPSEPALLSSGMRPAAALVR